MFLLDGYLTKETEGVILGYTTEEYMKLDADKKIWVWYCGFDTWTWSDGERCYAGSRKPTTKKNAESALNRHFKKHPEHTRPSRGTESLKGHVEVSPRFRKKK